ncbi:DEAD/DEAH box helicase [Candidatus Babeliales bacterium]|nr:DEAD/DEAH box helicase [Candidatus Babeliales bacterium]
MSKLKFEELNLSKELLKAVSDMGFEQTTPIQSKSIPEIILGNDVIGQASTGTGKTAAFGLPAIEKIDEELRAVQVLVLCPTRELAIQVSSEMNKFLKYKKNILVLPVYGGQPIQRQLFGLRRGPKIVVGTPGRTLDHIERGTLRLNKVKMVILDEADKMLDMGFRQDIEQILKWTLNNRQTVLFSATMSPDILRLTKRYQKNPKIIKVMQEKLDVAAIEQSYFDVEPSKKTDVLMQLLDLYNPKLSIVFCNTKRKVDAVYKILRAKGYLSAGIHGDIRQSKRDTIMSKFRNGSIKILVATDVAARGIDVANIEIIFNYGIPRERESYVHRIGRTGRAGKFGKAISLVSRIEFGRLRDIMRYTNTDIERKKVKNLSDIEFISKDKKEIKHDTFTNTRNIIKKQDKLFGRINNHIRRTRKEELSQYLLMMNNLVDNDNSLKNVSAALLKMVVEAERV